MKYLFVIVFFSLFANFLKAQQDSGILPLKDSPGQTHKKTALKNKMNYNTANLKTSDTLKIKDTAQNDTLSVANIAPLAKDSVKSEEPAKTKNYDSVLATIGLPIFAKPNFMMTPEKAPEQKNELFYAVAGLVFLLALVRRVFPSYFQNTFGLFLQTKGLDTNTKYLVQQNGPAFILMQLFFVFCGAIYMTLISQNYFSGSYSFGEKLLFSVVFLGSIYFIKDIMIKFLGWVFDLKAEAKIYLLYVFLVNRVLAIVLVPIVLVLSFSQQNVTYFALIISFILFAVFLVYRYFLTIKTIQPRLQAKTIQIFLYLCTVEFLPIVLLYKLIVIYTNGIN